MKNGKKNRGSPMQDKIKWPAITSLIILSGILGYATLTKGHDWGDDFASYLMQAQSIVEGTTHKFMEENRFTIEKSTNRRLGPVAYPWGMPVLLAPLYRLFGLNLLALKSLSVVCYVLFLAAIAFFLSPRHSCLYFLLLVSLFALNPQILSFLDEILSDIPFMFFSTTSVFLIGRILIERRPLISPLADRLLLGVFFAASTFIRINGVLLVPAAFGAQVFSLLQAESVTETLRSDRSSPIHRLVSYLRSETKNALIHASPYASFIGLALIWYHIFPAGETSHLSYFVLSSPRVVYQHLTSYFTLPAEFFSGAPYPHIIYRATLPFLAAGVIKSLYRDFPMFLYALFTVLLYASLPFNAALRYFYPLFPFYVHFVFVGLQWFSETLGGLRARLVQGLSVGLFAVVTVCFLQSAAHQALANIQAHRAVSSGPFTETSQNLFSFVRENTAEDSVIVFFKPRAMRMLTNRRSVQLDNPSELSLGSHLCIYLRKEAYSQLPQSTVEQLVRDGKLTLMYSNSDFRLYQIRGLTKKSPRTRGD